MSGVLSVAKSRALAGSLPADISIGGESDYLRKLQIALLLAMILMGFLADVRTTPACQPSQGDFSSDFGPDFQTVKLVCR